jgi:hypothetical protein
MKFEIDKAYYFEVFSDTPVIFKYDEVFRSFLFFYQPKKKSSHCRGGGMLLQEV